MRSKKIFGVTMIASLVALAAACSSKSTTAPGTDGGPGGGSGVGGTTDPGPGAILFAASGEVLALTGYAFPPANAGDPAFVDGWDVHFTRLLVTIDKITLSSNPDMSPGDESVTGPVVAEADGPWAVDLAHSDPTYLPGKGGPGEQAVPIVSLLNQNMNGGAPFATDGTRYAFGFQTVAASATAKNVNMDTAAQADYQTMVTNQCVVLYVGTATFKGGTVQGHTDCNSDPEYASWPKAVNFNLCFKSPTSYVNCQNPDNDPAKALGDEEHERGVAFLSDKSVIGQVTIHTDHPFWDSTLHDSPAHFDQFAARVSGMGLDGGATPTVTLEMTKGVDYSAYTDAQGHPLQWRYCQDPPTDVHPQLKGAMAFDPQSVPHATGGNAATGLRDYYDYSTYNQSTQGHLNSNGLCFVGRNYPSPK